MMIMMKWRVKARLGAARRQRAREMRDIQMNTLTTEDETVVTKRK
uniref:Uncharacterized protein n=1 Tax=Heterorhabditis bacteriophora TaxID=37862 RepID=A0A1I7X5U5_HETBA